MMLPGQILAQQAMMQQMQQQQMVRAQRAQPHEEYSTDTVIYKGGPPAQQPPAAAGKLRGPLPASGEDEFPPPPPERSADTSLNDSNSTTQSNVTSECSEAECDREHLLKDSPRASPEDPAQELTTEEMRKLIERNEIVPTTGLKPYNTVNV
jgi:hypothetical protein